MIESHRSIMYPRGSTKPCVLSTGDTIELYEPPSSGNATLRDGTCPGCKKSIGGVIARCATIRTYSRDGALYWSTMTSRQYGHRNCMIIVFDAIVRADSAPRVGNVPITIPSVTVPDNIDELLWTYGTQREWILAQQRNESPKQLVSEYDRFAPRSRRHKWRVVGGE